MCSTRIHIFLKWINGCFYSFKKLLFEVVKFWVYLYVRSGSELAKCCSRIRFRMRNLITAFIIMLSRNNSKNWLDCIFFLNDPGILCLKKYNYWQNQPRNRPQPCGDIFVLCKNFLKRRIRIISFWTSRQLVWPCTVYRRKDRAPELRPCYASSNIFLVFLRLKSGFPLRHFRIGCRKKCIFK